MQWHRPMVWSLAMIMASSVPASSGEVKIHLQGTLTDPAGKRTFDGDYPVTVRVWNGSHSPILTLDSVFIRVVKGKFLTHIGPYPELTREKFSTQKSLSFQMPDEPELAPRTRFRRMAASGEIYCDVVHLVTSAMPATSAGSKLRLGLLGNQSPQTGILLTMNRQVVELLDPDRPGMVNRIGLDSLQSLEISVRHRTHGEVGFIAGLALGAFAGYAMGSGETDDVSMSRETKRTLDAFAGAILGGLTGYLMGNSVTTDRWQVLPLDRVRNRAASDEEHMAGARR